MTLHKVSRTLLVRLTLISVIHVIPGVKNDVLLMQLLFMLIYLIVHCPTPGTPFTGFPLGRLLVVSSTLLLLYVEVVPPQLRKS